MRNSGEARTTFRFSFRTGTVSESSIPRQKPLLVEAPDERRATLRRRNGPIAAKLRIRASAQDFRRMVVGTPVAAQCH